MNRQMSTREIPIVRSDILQNQANRCAICQQLIQTDAVLDHNHATGEIRGVLHRGCNSMEGVVANRAAMYGITDMSQYLRGLADYLDIHRTSQHNLIHPTFKTPEQKKATAKRKAKLRRDKQRK